MPSFAGYQGTRKAAGAYNVCLGLPRATSLARCCVGESHERGRRDSRGHVSTNSWGDAGKDSIYGSKNGQNYKQKWKKRDRRSLQSKEALWERGSLPRPWFHRLRQQSGNKAEDGISRPAKCKKAKEWTREKKGVRFACVTWTA